MWILFALIPLAFAASKPGNDNEYFDILGSGQKEWRLAFRGTAGVRSSVYEAYKTGAGIPSSVQDGCKGDDFAATCNSHYRNADALDNWADVNDVLFGIVDDGAIVKTIHFNGTDTDNMDWFSQQKLIDSCYPDLKHTEKNFFSIDGHVGLKRRFFINQNYGGCLVDRGYFVAVDRENGNCVWENTDAYPMFKYASGLTGDKWITPTIIKKADAIVIFVRYMSYRGPAAEYHDVLNTGVKEYRLAFRGTSNIGVPMYPAYLNGVGVPSASTLNANCKKLDLSLPCTSHYRNNDALDNWDHVQEVLVVIVDKGAMVKYMTFSGLQTDKLTWFSKDKILDSCWEDLKRDSTTNFFSIVGHERTTSPPVARRFFINKNYGGCENDDGWLAVIDNANSNPRPSCAWEQTETYVPRIMYSPMPRVINWHKEQPKDADALLIFLKYDNAPLM